MKTQKEFLQAIKENQRWKNKLKEAYQRSDGAFYYTLGEAYNFFGVEIDWQGEAFILKLTTIIYK